MSSSENRWDINEKSRLILNNALKVQYETEMIASHTSNLVSDQGQMLQESLDKVCMLCKFA